eukprot:scaffold678_cov146-Skeletonema_menzelii.AAC.7
MIAPIYHDLSELQEFEGKVVFLKVNVSDHPDVASYYGVDGWPTFQLFRNERVVDSIVGGQAAKAGAFFYGTLSLHAYASKREIGTWHFKSNVSYTFMQKQSMIN